MFFGNQQQKWKPVAPMLVCAPSVAHTKPPGICPNKKNTHMFFDMSGVFAPGLTGGTTFYAHLVATKYTMDLEQYGKNAY